MTNKKKKKIVFEDGPYLELFTQFSWEYKAEERLRKINETKYLGRYLKGQIMPLPRVTGA